jgi:hypothetical protein
MEKKEEAQTKQTEEQKIIEEEWPDRRSLITTQKENM